MRRCGRRSWPASDRTNKVKVLPRNPTSLSLLLCVTLASAACAEEPSTEPFAADVARGDAETDSTLTTSDSSNPNTSTLDGSLLLDGGETAVDAMASIADSGISVEGGPIGFGRDATGGAGGASYVVTNLADSGEGSLRAGAESSGAKVITFAVSGTITLSSPIRPTADKTIDGAGKDVTVKAPNGSTIGGFELRQDNIIIRNLTIRGGGKRAGGGEGREDGILIFGAANVWIDHNHIYGWNDKGVGMPESSNVTISWNEFNNNAHSILIGTDATASVQGKSRTTVHHNYMHDSADRHPKINGGEQQSARMHSFNNYVENWGYGSAGPAMISVGSAQMLAENNIFKRGPRGGDRATCPTCNATAGPGRIRAVGNWLMDSAIYETERLAGTVFDPKGIYDYQAEAADEALRQKIMAGSGPNK